MVTQAATTVSRALEAHRQAQRAIAQARHELHVQRCHVAWSNPALGNKLFRLYWGFGGKADAESLASDYLQMQGRANHE